MEFVERTTAPKKDNKCYYSKDNPLYPEFTNNCTWYSWGRQEELGVPIKELKEKLPISCAENWYHDTKFPKFDFARVGDIGCYECGKLHHKADGMGHVFQVEKVYPDRSIDITDSGTKMKFHKMHLKYPYKYPYKSEYKYTFKGFIHTQDYDIDWEVGNYKALKEKYLRTSPKVDNNKYKYKNLTNNGKNNCVKDKLGYAKTKLYAIFKLIEFAYDDKGNIWGKTTNGKNGFLWICVCDSTGSQVKKI